MNCSFVLIVVCRNSLSHRCCMIPSLSYKRNLQAKSQHIQRAASPSSRSVHTALGCPSTHVPLFTNLLIKFYRPIDGLLISMCTTPSLLSDGASDFPKILRAWIVTDCTVLSRVMMSACRIGPRPLTHHMVDFC